MTEQLQPGLQQTHLDADQMSAFAEGLLPAHERQSALAHLALCAACREVLALSLPEVEPEPEPEPKRAWWQGWGLAWSGAAALAAILMVTVVLTRPHPQAKPPVAAVETARATPPVPLPSIVMPAPVRVTKAPPLLAPQLAPKAAIVLGQVRAAPAGGSIAGTIDSQNIEDLPVNGRNLSYVEKGPVRSQIHGAVPGGVIGGIAGGTGQAVVPGQGVAAAQARVQGPSQQMQMAAAPMAQQAASPQAVAVASAPAMSVDALADDASSLATELSTLAAAPVRKRASALPSGKAIASTAAAHGATVAIDSAGALFVSMDDGVHWKAVSAPWTGRAVSVGYRVSAPPKPVVVDENASAGYTLRTPAAGSASVTGVVTDATGAVIPGALVSAAGGVNRSTKSDGAGRYRFERVPEGGYQITVEAPGFEKRQVMVSLISGKVLEENVKLTVGAASQTVEVAAAPVLTVQKAKKMALSPVFEVTTEAGVKWVSGDGVSWSLAPR